jgi:hypothetical protein
LFVGWNADARIELVVVVAAAGGLDPRSLQNQAIARARLNDG